jgi:hypothetical protein
VASAAAAATSSAAEEFASGRRKLELIISDVDGTLLNPQQQLTPGVRGALVAAAEAGVPLVVATGGSSGKEVVQAKGAVREGDGEGEEGGKPTRVKSPISTPPSQPCWLLQ